MFEQLDYVYMPTADAARDLQYFTEVLGARFLFAVEGMGTRVAMVEVADAPPRLLLAEHLHGDAPVLVYRVPDLRDAMKELSGRGWSAGVTLEIPQGPVCSFVTPGGQHVAIYQRSRPQVEEHFIGRRDF